MDTNVFVLATFQSVSTSDAAIRDLRASGFEDATIESFYSGNVGSDVVGEERATGDPASGVVASGHDVERGLIDLGIPAREAQPYAEQIQHGAVVLSVACSNPDREREAKKALEKSGGKEISSLAAHHSIGTED